MKAQRAFRVLIGVSALSEVEGLYCQEKQKIASRRNAAMSMTFEQVVETIRHFSPRQREILADLIHSWDIEAVRHEISRDAKDSLAMFRRGELKSQSAQDAIKELLAYMNKEE